MARSITIEDLYHLKFVGRPRIAPDGSRVAYAVTTIDAHKHEYRSAIWVAATQGGEPRRFTSAAANATNPAWSPDGRWLAFLSERESDLTGLDAEQQKKHGKGKPQLWLLPIDGGEARQLTFLEHGVSSVPAWSPDSTQLLFCAPVGKIQEEEVDGKRLPRARVIDRLWYRLDGAGFIYELRSHLFLINVNGGDARQLTTGDYDHAEPAWSPDGTQIVFGANRNEDRWRWPGNDIYIRSLQDDQEQRLTDGKLECCSPSWSPDGKTVAFIGAPKLHGAGYYYLYTATVENGTPTVTCLTEGLEISCADWTNSDIGDEHLAPAPAWSSDGQTLYTLAAERGATRLYAVPVSASAKKVVAVTPGAIHVRDFTLDAAGKTLALLVGDATHPQEVFVQSVEPGTEMSNLSHANETLLSELELSSPEQLLYTGADGWPVEGWVIKPFAFDETKKYPLVVEVHGGPNTQYGYGFFHEMQLLAAQGYVVLYTNPRGSIGYGYDFAHAVYGAWGEKDSFDILHGVDALLKKGYIDEQRLAVTGGSYGGFMTNWLVGHHPDRFKVAITDRCVSNMATMFGTSDLGWSLAEDHVGTTPWEDLGAYMRMSPISHVHHIRTPLLIIHSDQDLRCSLEQAEQLFIALKWLGRETQLVRFEDQSHGLSRSGHPKLRKERLQHIVDWFAKYIV